VTPPGIAMVPLSPLKPSGIGATWRITRANFPTLRHTSTKPFGESANCSKKGGDRKVLALLAGAELAASRNERLLDKIDASLASAQQG